MRVIVTGAGGFIGRRVVAECLRRGHAVDAVLRPGSPAPACTGGRGVTVVRAELRGDLGPVAERLEGAGALVHLAATTTGSPRVRFDGTVGATERLLGAIAAAGWRGRLVLVSSFAVYDFNGLRRGARVDESTPLEPAPGRRDEYAWTKSWQERIVREAAARGEVDAVVVRPGAVYGPERRFQQRLGRPLGRDGLLLVGGLGRMPLTYVENTASLLVTCAEHPAAAGETFNAVDPDPLRRLTYVRRWRAAADGPRRVVPVPLAAHRAARAGYAVADRLSGGAVRPPGFFDGYMTTPNLGRFRWDGSRATRVLGWSPPVPVADALHRTFSQEPLHAA